jgi:hypothetical protein
VTLDGLGEQYQRAEVIAKRSNGRKDYEITTKNVTRLTLSEIKDASVRIDGQTIKVKTDLPQVVLEKTGVAWKVAKPGAWAGLHKTHALQGPIDDAFLDPFLLVRPTGTPWNDAANKDALRILDHFDHMWAMDYRAHPRIKDDKDVTKEDFAKYNVVLFGDPGSNRWIAKMMPKLPLKFPRGGESAGAGVPESVESGALRGAQYRPYDFGWRLQRRLCDAALRRHGGIENQGSVGAAADRVGWSVRRKLAVAES